MKLAELQRYFARAATTGSGPIENLERVFLGTESLSASARLAIYNRGYFYRLLEALASVFAETKRALGQAEFERIGLAYLAQHPSDHAAVERVGRSFAGQLRTTPGVPSALADLAALEWARLCALVAPDPPKLVSAHSVDPVRFPDSQLQFVSALRWLELDSWALHAFAGANGPAADPQSRRGVAVWRIGHAVRHEALEALEFRALQLAASGAKMSEVCALFDTGAPQDDAQRAFRVVAAWFSRQWIESSTVQSEFSLASDR